MLARQILSSARSKFRPASSYVALFLVLLYPLFCRYDFSKSTFSYYDFLSMNQNILWLVLLVVVAVLVSISRNSDLPMPSFVAIVLLFSVVEIYTNYPMIWRDVFFHGSAVRSIMAAGHTGGTYLKYPDGQPGFFLLWSVVSIVTGIDTIECNLVLLLPIGIIAMIALTLFVCRRLGIGVRNVTALLIFLLMNSHANEFMFVHFNTRMLSFIYVLVFLCFLVMGSNRGTKAIGVLLANTALIVAHVLNSLVPIVFLGLAVLFRDRRVGSTLWLFLSCGVVYVVWNLISVGALLTAGLSSLAAFYYRLVNLEAYLSWSPKQGLPEPLFGLMLRNYYKMLLVTLGLVSTYCVARLRRERRVKIVGYYLVCVSVVFGLSFPLLGWISIDRALIFLSLALGILPIMLLGSIWGKPLAGWRRWTLAAMVIVLIIPNYVLVHEPAIGRWADSGSLSEASVFMAAHRDGQKVVSLSDFPIFYSYYEPSYDGYDNLKFEGLSSLSNVTDFLSTRPVGSLRIVDYRRVVDWGWGAGDVDSYEQARAQWDKEVYAELDLHLNIVYSTGFETIYR